MITKDDLQLGDILITRGWKLNDHHFCYKYILCNTITHGLCMVGNTGWVDYNRYKSNLKHPCDSFWDVIAVYRPPKNKAYTKQYSHLHLSVRYPFDEIIKLSKELKDSTFINLKDYIID